MFDRSGKEHLGHALETVVLLVLRRRGAEVAYVKTPDGLEVDFIAHYPDGTQHLIQVSADVGAAATLDREYRALAAAVREYPRASRHLLTLTPEAVRERPAGVQVHAAEEWLLAEDHQD